MNSYEELRRIALKASSEAAALLRDLACDDKYTAKVKGETIRADIESESYLVDLLRREVGGGLAVVSEERGLDGKPEGLVAIIDPLDGSTNYSSCIPWASVSVAFAKKGSSGWELVAGAVAPVFWGYPLSFLRGGGCFEGEARARRKEHPPRVLSVYVERSQAASTVLRVLEELGEGYKVRSLGSSALEISYVGLGRIAGFMDFRGRLRNVDIAAAIGVVMECGGEVFGDDGLPLKIPVEEGVVRLGTVVAASDAKVAAAARKALRTAVGHEG
ncbi:MAG: hypothetical protein F7B17_07505 [Desulfurococcales archaeon]|nr:hypothetical protein [Desulfurococcales archaeon]